MYQTNQAFLEAMDDISRTLTVQVEISGEIYPTESIIDFELERGAFDGDVFTIGQTLSSALTLTIFTTSSVKLGDEVKLFTDLLVGESYVRVPMGVYYVDSTSVNQEKMTLTCYDKMVSLVEEYIPSGDHKTLAALFNDVRSQIGMKYDGAFTDIAIKQPLYGYTYRETLGFIASLNGGNMTINRGGNLEIKGYQAVERHIPAKTCFSFDVKEPYRVSKVFCQFGDVGVTRGDSSGQCVAFENPYVTEQNIDVIYQRLNGLYFTAGSLKYRGDLTLDPGDLFTFTDYKGGDYVLMCGRNKLTFNGGLSGQLESIGESEKANNYTELQLKYKKNITKVTAELGKIQAVVQEIEQSHDGLEERVKNAELEMTADAITSKIKDTFVSKDEAGNLVTQEQLTSTIQQTSNDITLQVSSNYETKTEVANKINAIQVGGTNLLPNTKTLESGVSSTSYIISETYLGLKVMRCNNTSGSHIDAYSFGSLINVEPNAEYTLSFYAKGNGAFNSFFYPNNVSTGIHSNGSTTTSNDGYITTTVTSSWKRYWITWKTASNASGLKNVIISRVHSGADIYICGAKFEKGNKASEWSPCPDDIETTVSTIERRVSTAESKITDEAITNTVKQNFYTKTETENAITNKDYATKSEVQQTATSITNEVSQTYYTKSDIENKGYTTSSELKQTIDEFEFKFYNENNPNLVLNGGFEKDEDYTKNIPFNLDSMYGGVGGYPTSIDGGKFLRLYTDGGESFFEKKCAIPVTPQKTYTISYYYCSTITAQGSNYLYINGNLVKLNIQYAGDRAWHRAVHKITLGSNVSGIDAIRLGVVASEACWVLFDNLQVELGDQVTDFKPHKTEFNTGITFIDSEGVGVKHSDGTYTKMTSNGFVRKIGDADHLYHYLSYVGKVQKLDMSAIKIQLPSQFKNKTFRVILSLEEIANPAGYMVQSIHLVADNYNYANATFEILYGSMSQSHDGTTGMMRPTTISYTVIA